MRITGRSGLGIISAIAIAFAGVAGTFVADAGAAPVGYSTTPVAGWQTNGTVWSVLVVGDTVYAGGAFTQVRSQSGQTVNRTNLAAFDRVTGEVRTGFVANTNGAVRAVAYDNGRIFVGGPFTTIGGIVRDRLAAVNASSGAVIQTWSANASANVIALAVNGGRLFAGGVFTTIGGQPRNRIAAVSTATGAVDPDFNPNADNEVRAIAVAPNGSTVYAGGSFTNIHGLARSYLAPLSSTTGAVLPIMFERGDRARVFDLDVSPSGNQLFAGLGGLENRVVAWNAATGARQWQQLAMGDTQAVRYSQGNVYFAFHEGFAGDTSVRVLAADAATGVLVPTFRPPINTFYAAWTLDASEDALVIGGEFTIISGVRTQGVAIMPFHPTDPSPPTPPTNVHVTASSATSVTLGWNPGTDNNGVAGYRVLRDGVDVGYPTATTFTDTGLLANHDYSYTVQTQDTAGNFSPQSAPVNTGTDLTLLPARSTWRYLDNGSNQGTAWRAPGFDDGAWAQGPAQLGYGDGDEATVVGFGPDPNHKYATTYFRTQFNVANASQVGAVTLHIQRDDGAVVYLNGTEVVRTNMPAGAIASTTFASVTVDGAAEQAFTDFTVNPALLTNGTNTLAVEVHQRSGNSSDISFDLSLDSARVNGPAAPSNLHTTGVTGTTVDLAWDPPAGTISGYRVYRDGGLVGSPSTPAFPDTGLAVASSHSYTVTAVNGTGVESGLSSPVSVTTLDTVAPGAPTGLNASTVTGARVLLNWDAPIDNVGVTGYDVLRDGSVIGTPATPTYNDTSVAPNTSYQYEVRAKDAAGNQSGLSDPITVLTPDGGDTSLPTQPQNLHVTARGATTVTLAWDASSDDIGVDVYSVRRNDVEVGTPSGTTFTVGSLAPGSTSAFTVVARDGAGNESDPSTAVPVTTHASDEIFFPQHSVWRYTQDGVDRGTAWRAPSYDDSSWPSGPGQLGYFDGDEATVMNSGGATQFVSHYLRRNVVVSDPQNITALTLSVLADDGVIVYVNGVEAFRLRMPAGTINFNTFANQAVSGAAENAYTDFVIPASMLVPGNNVIAAEIHNNSRHNNSDLGFDASLRGHYS